jgi:hypothetical protein
MLSNSLRISALDLSVSLWGVYSGSICLYRGNVTRCLDLVEGLQSLRWIRHQTPDVRVSTPEASRAIADEDQDDTPREAATGFWDVYSGTFCIYRGSLRKCIDLILGMQSLRQIRQRSHRRHSDIQPRLPGDIQTSIPPETGEAGTQQVLSLIPVCP